MQNKVSFSCFTFSSSFLKSKHLHLPLVLHCHSSCYRLLLLPFWPPLPATNRPSIPSVQKVKWTGGPQLDIHWCVAQRVGAGLSSIQAWSGLRTVLFWLMMAFIYSALLCSQANSLCFCCMILNEWLLLFIVCSEYPPKWCTYSAVCLVFLPGSWYFSTHYFTCYLEVTLVVDTMVISR